MARPEYVEQDHLEYLDELRESGITNMFGASGFLVKAFPGLEPSMADKILKYWMDSFGKEDR